LFFDAIFAFFVDTICLRFLLDVSVYSLSDFFIVVIVSETFPLLTSFGEGLGKPGWRHSGHGRAEARREGRPAGLLRRCRGRLGRHIDIEGLS